MKEYQVPVVVTTIGWIVIKAESLEAAKEEGARLNEEGVDMLSLSDSSTESEVLVDEIHELGK
jgi:hypothetical protein